MGRSKKVRRALKQNAASAGEGLSAVTSALDDVAARGRRARKKARKRTAGQAAAVRTSAQRTVRGARRQSARQLRVAASRLEEQPKRRRGRALASVVVVGVLGVAVARALGDQELPPPQHLTPPKD